MIKKRWFKIISIAWILLVVTAACNLPFIGKELEPEPGVDATPTSGARGTVEPTSEVPAPTLLPPEELYKGKFAEYPVLSVSLPEKFTGGYELPLTADQVKGLQKYDLTKSQVDALLMNGFVVQPPDFDPNRGYHEFYQAYESIRYDETPIFVTTDSLLHVYHLIFDKMLRDLERNSFIPTLKELVAAMVDSTLRQYETLKGSSLEDAALRNVAYMTVPAIILGLDVNVPSGALDLAKKEIDLIEGQGGYSISPIWDTGAQAQDDVLLEDYSQYIPRGHYTRSEDFKAYFKAMMWLGRMTFRLKDQGETQRALLLVQAIRSAQPASGASAQTLWEKVFDPTVFIVGKADDLSIYEYGTLSDRIFGATPDLTAFSDQALLDQFFEAAKQLPPPQINSMWVYIWQDRDQATQGFRFMGQRFTLDAYIFGQLMWRKVGTLEKPRDLPKSLDVLAAMGSDEAYSLLLDMGEGSYENYETQMTKVKGEVASFGKDSWTQNLYWSWLYTLQPVFAIKGEQYPAFMRTKAWLHKDMHTALSSWTELKHDTILYAKQVMAEMGGGPMDEPPKGYVEPNPEMYARLLALTEMTLSGLENRGLLDDATKGNLESLRDQLAFFLDISQRELKGEKITADEYWRIQYFGGWLEALTVAAADPATPDEGSGYLEDQKSALVADVATGMGRVLEEGVGYPTKIYVVTPVSPYRIAVGAVYTYYEFEVLPENRMTDEDWRQMLETGNAPEPPAWTSSFIIK